MPANIPIEVNVDLKIDETGKVLVEKVSSGLGSVLADAAKELGGMLGDQMRLWRFKNALSISQKVTILLEKHQIDPQTVRKIGFGDQFLLLEKMSFEEKDEVQSMWAGLIFNSIKPDRTYSPTKRILDILQSLNPAEAGFMRVMAFAVDLEKRRFSQPDGIDLFRTTVLEIAQKHWRHHGEEVAQAALQNLIRLRCIAFRPSLSPRQLFATLPSEFNKSPFKKWSAIDESEFRNLLTDIGQLFDKSSGLVLAKIPEKDRGNNSILWGSQQIPLVREFAFGLTYLGVELVKACETEIDFSKYPGEL
jgi:flagellar biosynthesis regulator FlbT